MRFRRPVPAELCDAAEPPFLEPPVITGYPFMHSTDDDDPDEDDPQLAGRGFAVNLNIFIMIQNRGECVMFEPN